MKNINFRVLLSAVCVASILAGFTKVSAGPVRFEQVVQIVNAKPGKATTGAFSRLAVAGDYSSILISDDDDKDKKTQQQDGRVITETRSEIVEDENCDCVEDDVHHRGFPKWALLGLAAIPIAFIIIRRKKDTPTPTPSMSIPITQTPTLTPTPPMTPTCTPTPPVTPTPPPEPVPEPMTILLFGTGLASVGLAARRRFGKKGDEKSEDEED